jgi:hypothetical protein
MAVGSVLFKGKGLLPVHKNELLLFAPGQGFYNTWREDNQKAAFVSQRAPLVFYLDRHP